ncbi:MAG: hypothetical protein P8080_02895 [Gammaproteobacteria bacterium]
MRKAIYVLLALMVPAVASGQGAPPTVELCSTCHGESAPSPYADVPTIHGLPEVVIEIALYDFHGKARPCRKASCAATGDCSDITMCDVAVSMDHANMEALAVWYEARNWVPAPESFNPALAARGKVLHAEQCEICHTAGGTDPRDEASILRGQRMEYLRTALADYQAGRRTAVAAMDDLIRALEADELEALVHYYASPVEGGG